ncbi:MAG: TetR/AcrR family transcriptional regulator [Candidatus Lokiarchaeota archaeon]|nr:TetR/AcrR family transcriptional regulator [Candidatus Lokiarchaeota archaeon]
MSDCSLIIHIMQEKKFTRNKQEKIDKIFDIFFDLVLKNGYNKTSTNSVAEASGLSIGTVYRYFPEGKKDIIRKYFEKSVETTMEIEDFKNLETNDIPSAFRGFISNLVRNNYANKGYNLAFRSAILSDPNLLNDHNKRVFDISKGFVKILRKSNEFFKSREELRLIRGFVFIYNLSNAIIYHHIFLMKFFEKDEDLIDYLSNLMFFTIQTLSKM